MAPPPNITTLPLEILTAIVDLLLALSNGDKTDVIALSKTCKTLRHRLSPVLFHTLCFSNSLRASSLALLAAETHGQHIKVLRFVGHSDHNLGEPGYRCEILPTSARALFSQTARDGRVSISPLRLPNLEKISIYFAHDYDKVRGRNSPIGGKAIFENDEEQGGAGASRSRSCWERVAEREERIPSVCGLWRNTYEALASAPRVRELVIENWSPRGVSVFASREWKEFLGKLERLEVRLAVSEPDKSRDGAIMGYEGYKSDVARMGEFFFQHLREVKKLEIGIGTKRESDDGRFMFGLAGKPYRYASGTRVWKPFLVPLPFKDVGGGGGGGGGGEEGGDESMPLLEELVLRNVFLSQDLVDFIVRCKMLRKVVLENAQAFSHPWIGAITSVSLTWEGFFDAMCVGLDKHPDSALSELSFTTKTPRVHGLVPPPSDRKTPRWFGYGWVDALFVADARTTEESGYAGKDQAAYDRFIEKLDEKRRARDGHK
ncbi:hypothetical protein QBC42DRAFT_314716 [Cladorrhinum samala]|uniref:F-box domain-containing protein n=1 Tax=Cladorrhinum samala TaxID=585594 RepID=A0AAV9HEL6_9PEZI|nr:hypothetical protein QBC42DRAFT_314716 [Cladorrhinum samala]